MFSPGQSSLYYKLEQAVGDEGMPSNSITVNLNNIKCYEATVSLNSKGILIYVGLDGYIYSI